MGKGKYFEKHGYVKAGEIFEKHYMAVQEIVKKYGFESIIWGDTAVNVDFKTEDSFICWDYYTEDIKEFKNKLLKFKQASANLWYAGGIITWLGYAPYNKLSAKITKTNLKICKEQGVKNVLITMWGDDGKECSYFSWIDTLSAKYYLFRNRTVQGGLFILLI